MTLAWLPFTIAVLLVVAAVAGIRSMKKGG